MAQIKTALEIALERTASVKSDKAAGGAFEARQHGKKLANEFLDAGGSAEAVSKLEKAIKNAPEAEKASLRQGIFDILRPQIALPAVKEDIQRLDTAGKGLAVVLGNAHFSRLWNQFMQAASQFLQEEEQYDKALVAQYSPRLRQKEEALSRQLGTPVRLDPLQDPEFAAAYNQAMGELRKNYEPLQEQVRQAVQSMFG